MKSQREFCLSSVLQEFPALTRPPADHHQRLDRDQKVGERLDRLRQIGIESTRQRVKQIEAMIVDFERMARTLEADIRAEEDRAGIHEAGHFAYPTCARAMTQRRDNLKRSIAELTRQLTDAKVALD
jgi:flagellar protein FliJ